jgi:hypothetical protein
MARIGGPLVASRRSHGEGDHHYEPFVRGAPVWRWLRSIAASGDPIEAGMAGMWRPSGLAGLQQTLSRKPVVERRIRREALNGSRYPAA